MSDRQIRCAVLTISDRCNRGEAEDQSGKEVTRLMQSFGWNPECIEILPDDEDQIAERLASLSDAGFALIVTTGGTGLGPRDRTPEATLRVVDRQVPGLGELIRARTGALLPLAYLSRGVAGIRGHCLIINLPGSPRGVEECLQAILPALPHAMEVLKGEAGECATREDLPHAH